MIIDDHEVVRDGLERLLMPEGISTRVKCPDGSRAMAAVRGQEIDVALIDIRLVENDGLDVLDQLRSAAPELGIVMMTAFENITYMARSVALGASDYVSKDSPISWIADVLRDAASGSGGPRSTELARIQGLMRSGVPTDALPSEMPLTPRETQVLCHLGLGLSNREIARSLSISIETVKEHVQNILRKIGATDRTAAAVRAVRAGLAG